MRTKSVTIGVRSSSSRQRSRIPRAPYPRPRSGGSTHTCCTWTAAGVQAEASALNSDRAVLDPEPGAALGDLRARPPAKRFQVARERIDPELALVRGRADGDEPLEIVEGGGPQPALPGPGGSR